MSRRQMGRDGLVVVDKPSGLTSHDVVARIRRLAGTRRVGHGGTLDPMATGVLIIGVERATRLLTYVIGATKSYAGTIRLGQSTMTDDAEGEVVARGDAGAITEAQVHAALRGFVGEIDQVPSAVSAIKVGGVRSYARARRGEEFELPARRVTISRLEVTDIRRIQDGDGRDGDGRDGDGRDGGEERDSEELGGELLDVDIEVTCSSGTYIRAIARDLGTALGVGGHLSALRRTAVGAITLAEAATLEELGLGTEPPVLAADRVLSLEAAAQRFFPRRDVSVDEARVLSHGGSLPPSELASPYAVFSPTGQVVAIMADRSGRARPEIVLAPAEVN